MFFDFRVCGDNDVVEVFVLALDSGKGNEDAAVFFLKYFDAFGITDPNTIVTLLLIVGIMDVTLALMVLIKPIRIFVLWMALWGLWTALIRWPFGGDPVWDFLERWTNWGAPLALLLLRGWPGNIKEWFK